VIKSKLRSENFCHRLDQDPTSKQQNLNVIVYVSVKHNLVLQRQEKLRMSGNREQRRVLGPDITNRKLENYTMNFVTHLICSRRATVLNKHIKQNGAALQIGCMISYGI
jgi:hypothetical protein